MKILNICGHSFLGNLLKAAPVVLDCGANEGLFSHNIHQKYNKSIIHGFEPDPRLYPELPSIPNVEFHQLAISGNNGNINLFLGDTRNSSTRFEEAPEQNHVLVNAITLAQFCQDNFIEYIDLIKLDIEGTEIDVFHSFDDRFLARVAQITVEFHDFLNKDEIYLIENIIENMRKKGFTCIKFSQFDYSDVLMININLYPISLWKKFLIYFSKYFLGILRIIRRLLYR